MVSQVTPAPKRTRRKIGWLIAALSTILAGTPIVVGAPAVQAATDSLPASNLADGEHCTGAGDVQFYGDLECGTPNAWSPWSILAERLALSPLSFQRDTAQKTQGTYSGNYYVQNGDDAGTPSGERSETWRPNALVNPGGTTTYHAFAIRYNTVWPTCQSWCINAQWKQGTGPVDANFNLQAPRHDKPEITNLNTFRFEKTIGGVTARYPIMNNTAFVNSLGTWHEFVVRVTWSTTNGNFAMWHAPGNGVYTLVTEQSGVQTLNPAGGNYEADMDVSIGMYRGVAAGGMNPHRIWGDGYCIASDWTTAANCLN